MLYSEIIAVCSQLHTKHINTLCGQNVVLQNVKLVVHIVNTGPWRMVNSGSPRSTTVFLMTIQKNDGFATRRPKISKPIKTEKMRKYKYRIHVKKQHSQSEMRTVPIYHVSQSRMGLIKLLK